MNTVHLLDPRFDELLEAASPSGIEERFAGRGDSIDSKSPCWSTPATTSRIPNRQGRYSTRRPSGALS